VDQFNQENAITIVHADDQLERAKASFEAARREQEGDEAALQRAIELSRSEKDPATLLALLNEVQSRIKDRSTSSVLLNQIPLQTSTSYVFDPLHPPKAYTAVERSQYDIRVEKAKAIRKEQFDLVRSSTTLLATLKSRMCDIPKTPIEDWEDRVEALSKEELCQARVRDYLSGTNRPKVSSEALAFEGQARYRNITLLGCAGCGHPDHQHQQCRIVNIFPEDLLQAHDGKSLGKHPNAMKLPELQVECRTASERRVLCTYSVCNKRSSHNTLMCKTLHKRCTVCGMRGHHNESRDPESIMTLLCPFQDLVDDSFVSKVGPDGKIDYDDDVLVKLNRAHCLFELSAGLGQATRYRDQIPALGFWPCRSRIEMDMLFSHGYHQLLDANPLDVLKYLDVCREGLPIFGMRSTPSFGEDIDRAVAKVNHVKHEDAKRAERRIREAAKAKAEVVATPSVAVAENASGFQSTGARSKTQTIEYNNAASTSSVSNERMQTLLEFERQVLKAKEEAIRISKEKEATAGHFKIPKIKVVPVPKPPGQRPQSHWQKQQNKSAKRNQEFKARPQQHQEQPRQGSQPRQVLIAGRLGPRGNSNALSSRQQKLPAAATASASGPTLSAQSSSSRERQQSRSQSNSNTRESRARVQVPQPGGESQAVLTQSILARDLSASSNNSATSGPTQVKKSKSARNKKRAAIKAEKSRLNDPFGPMG
jgi:hypothetical protein